MIGAHYQGLMTMGLGPNAGITWTERVTNGTMEADSDWTSFQTPETNEQSAVQARGGTYSRHVVDSTPSSGGIYQDLTTTATKSYLVSFWYYLVSGSLTAQLAKGDNSGWEWTSDPLTTTDVWTQVNATVVQSITGASSRLVFRNTSAVSAAEFYIDDVMVLESSA